MWKKSRTSSTLYPRGGTTLIEVVAGLALLSTLLVGILAAYNRHAAQIRRASRRLDAIRATDRLLAEWFAAPGRFPRLGHGSVPGSAGLGSTRLGNTRLVWRTEPVAGTGVDALGARIVRLHVFDAESTEATRREPLVTVDVVLPVPEPVSAGEEGDER